MTKNPRQKQNPYMKNAGFRFPLYSEFYNLKFSNRLHTKHMRNVALNCGVLLVEMCKISQNPLKDFLSANSKNSRKIWWSHKTQQHHGIPSKVFSIRFAVGENYFFHLMSNRCECEPISITKCKMSNSNDNAHFFVRCDNDAKWRFANVIRCSEWINYAS